MSKIFNKMVNEFEDSVLLDEDFSVQLDEDLDNKLLETNMYCARYLEEEFDN